MFGTNLLVAPITVARRPRPPASARVTAWLPPGEWIDVFTGADATAAIATLHLHRDLDSIPVLARAGDDRCRWCPADAPRQRHRPPSSRSRCASYAGADGEFTLVEDRDDERWARTRITYDDATGEVTVHDVDGRRRDAAGRPFATTRSWSCDVDPDPVAAVFAILDRAQMGFELKGAAYEVIRTSPTAGDALAALQALEVSTGPARGADRGAPGPLTRSALDRFEVFGHRIPVAEYLEPAEGARARGREGSAIGSRLSLAGQTQLGNHIRRDHWSWGMTWAV